LRKTEKYPHRLDVLGMERVGNTERNPALLTPLYYVRAKATGINS
jgi:hypothetical protein